MIELAVNFAATTRFDERYDVALDTNAMDAYHSLSFAKKFLNIKWLLHVSSAYVCGERSRIIPENPFYYGETLTQTCNKLDITAEKELVKEKLHELEAEDAREQEITSTMKGFRLRRYCLVDDGLLEAVKFLDLGDSAGWELLQAMPNPDFRKRPIAEAFINPPFMTGAVL